MITNALKGEGQVVHIGVLKKENKYLVARRLDTRDYPNLLEFPGGKQEANELSFTTLQRELKEELDITIWEATPLLGVCYRHLRLFFYLVLTWEGEPKLIDHSELKWLMIEEILNSKDLINKPMFWIAELLKEW